MTEAGSSCFFIYPSVFLLLFPDLGCLAGDNATAIFPVDTFQNVSEHLTEVNPALRYPDKYCWWHIPFPFTLFNHFWPHLSHIIKLYKEDTTVHNWSGV